MFSKALNFARKASKKQLEELLQDSSPAKVLYSLLSSPEGLDKIDVIEIFLLSATATVETKGQEPSAKRIEFDDDSLKVTWVMNNTKHQKEIIIIRRLIDINFLFDVSVSQGNREPLTVEFKGDGIECIQAASEQNYESFLCVLPATLLTELYKKHSSRMLEENVRSFLQLNNSVNKGIQDTIRYSPEKFIAYNNGLTITATGKELKKVKDKLYLETLTDFQIVNGGQTTATIYFSAKAGLDISKVRIMAKINVARDASEDHMEGLITKISAYSNAHSRVSLVDLRSRNSQLIKLKSLSESIMTPSEKKWFFERAKGEFNTLLRKNPQAKNRINKDFPKERRFTKEELAKYYIAWGDQPYLVKKGGEKVFRFFIEEISGDSRSKKPAQVDRDFYEELIARIILFKALERLYGSGAGAIGQIRSAVVPYTISILYKYTNGQRNMAPFNLTELWKNDGMYEETAQAFFSLMSLMNELIKTYAASDDYGEYSKKPELWNKINACPEIEKFSKSSEFQKIIKRYCTDSVKTVRSRKNKQEINFEPLYNIVHIFSKTANFYKQILSELYDMLNPGEVYKLEQIISAIEGRGEIQVQHAEFEEVLLNKIRVDSPDFFDRVHYRENLSLKHVLDFVVTKYNSAIEKNEDILSVFDAIQKIAAAKGAKQTGVFNEIGKALSRGELPGVRQLQVASDYTGMLKSNAVILK